MPSVTFEHPGGRSETHEAPVGDSVMDCALDNHVEGIGGKCGGACNCSTCHCYVDSPWFEQLPARSEAETELLGYLETRRSNSRLGCQVVLSEELDGLVVEIPLPERTARDADK